MRCLLVFFIVAGAGLAEARVDLEVSRSLSAGSFSNTITVGARSEVQTLSYTYSSALTVVNLNPNLSDFEINYAAHELSYYLKLPAGLTFDLNYSLTGMNQDEAATQQYSAGLYFKIKKVQFGFSSAFSKTVQKQDVIILSRNYRDEIKFNQTAASYYLDVEWTDSFLTSARYTYYAYDENLDNFNTLLTTQVFLNRAGGSVANEVQTQPRNAAELNFAYIFNENWMFNLGIGSSQDYLAPSDRTNEGKLGVEYELDSDDVSYRFFYTLNSAKNTADNSVMTSHFFGFGAGF